MHRVDTPLYLRIVYFCKADLNMAKDIDIWNGDIVLSESMEIMHKRLRYLSKLQYSFCCSPSGCLPSRVAVNSQGAAIGENLLRHSVPLGGAIQRLQGSDRYSLLHCRRIVPTDTSFMSLQGSDRYSLRQGRRIAPTDTPFVSLKGSDKYSPAA